MKQGISRESSIPGQGGVPAESSSLRWIALAIIVIAAVMTTLDDFVVFVAEPALQRDLHMSAAELQWVVAGYVLAYGVAVISGGRLGDIFGHLRIFRIGLWGFVLTSVLCGLAPNAPFLLGARVLEGLAAAIMFPQVFSLLKLTFSEREQPLAFGILGAVIGISAIAGQLVGGFLLGANLWGWQWRPIFLLNVPIGLLAVLLVPFLLVESRSTTATRVDVVGMVLSAGVLLLCIFPLVQGHEMGWSWWMWLVLLAFLPALWLFVAYERRRAIHPGSPLIELALFRHTVFVRGIALLLLETALGSSLFFILTLFLQSGYHFSAFEAALAFVPMAVSYTIGSLLTGTLIRYFQIRILQIGIAIASLGAITTCIIVQNSVGRVTTLSLLPLAIMGFGNALVATPLPGFIVSTVGKDAAGAASGTISMAQQVGPAFGVAVIGVVFFGVLEGNASAYSAAFISSLLIVTLGICVLQLLLTFGLVPGKKQI